MVNKPKSWFEHPLPLHFILRVSQIFRGFQVLATQGFHETSEIQFVRDSQVSGGFWDFEIAPHLVH
jgi:hypothetical protein